MADDSNGNTQTYQVKSGQGFMLFPGQITTYSADHDLPWEYVWVEFDGLRAKGAVELAGLSMNQPIYHARSKDLRENMMNEMMYLVEHRDMPPPASDRTRIFIPGFSNPFHHPYVRPEDGPSP